MFNVAVINIKDIIKYLVGIVITISVIMFLTRYFSNSKENVKLVVSDKVEKIKQNSMTKCFNTVLPGIEESNEELNKIAKEDDDENYDIFAKIIDVELNNIEIERQVKLIAKQNNNLIAEGENQNDVNNQNANVNNFENGESVEANENKEEKYNQISENNSDEVTNSSDIQTGVSTQIVTENPIKESTTNQYGNVKIKNESKYELTEEILNPNIEIQNKNILVFHTHTCESYTSSEKYCYIPTGNYRTTDLNYTVARVGDELCSYMQGFGYNTIHDKTYHDYPAYNGSYTRSLNTVQNLLKETTSEVIIDLHRDAIGSNSNYAPTVKIGDEYAAQLMFVIGTDGSGLWHPNWNNNLKFAIKVQQKAEELYPGLFKPIILRNSRYNQQLGKCACIIEVGATGNTLEQCLTSMKYLSKVLDEVMK